MTIAMPILSLLTSLSRPSYPRQAGLTALTSCAVQTHVAWSQPRGHGRG